MNPISFQSTASDVCVVTTAVFIDFFLKKLNVFSKHIGKKQKNKWITEICRTNDKQLTNVDTVSVLITSLDIT